MRLTYMNKLIFAARRCLATASALIAAACVIVVGCDFNKTLEVQSPSRIPAASLEDPSNAVLLVTGAVADFECAFGSYVVAGGLITEELDDYLQTANRWPFDQRTLQSNNPRYSSSDCTANGVYTPLQTARVSADNIRQLLEKWTDAQVPNRAALLARANAYEAWSMLLLAEGFCSTVFSTIQNGEFVYAGEITRNAALADAETHFTAAISGVQGLTDTASVNLRYMAYLGRARTRLDLGNLAGAGSDAAQVPATFVYNATASTISARRNNRVYNESNSLGVSSTVGPVYRALNDPRVTFKDLGATNAVGVHAYAQLKYGAASTSIPLATATKRSSFSPKPTSPRIRRRPLRSSTPNERRGIKGCTPARSTRRRSRRRSSISAAARYSSLGRSSATSSGITSAALSRPPRARRSHTAAPTEIRSACRCRMSSG